MKISAVRIQNFKRLKHVEIDPGVDRTLVLIGGDNGNGKSSVLDALSVAFAGGKAAPPEPIRRGEKKAEIRVELDGGAIVIRRTFTAKGGALEVIDAAGIVRKPQERLDAIVGKRFIDPLAILSRPAADQRAALLAIIPEADQIAKLDADHDAAFARRTDMNRDLKRAEAQLEGIPPKKPVPPATDVADQRAKLTAARATLDQAQVARRAYETEQSIEERARATVARLEAEMERLKRDLGVARAELDQARELVASAAARRATVPSVEDAQKAVDAVMSEMTAAAEKNTAAASARADNARREAAERDVAALRKSAEHLTDVIETAKATKAAILAGAKMPVDGLGVDATGITLNGLPLEQASSAEQLRVALGIAAAGAGQLRDIWIHDGSLLDTASLAIVAGFAEAAGICAWIERVGVDDGAIVISDGSVASGGGS